MEKVTMSLAEMSERMGLSKPKCSELLNRENGVPYIRVGKRILIPIKAFEEWLNVNAVK